MKNRVIFYVALIMAIFLKSCDKDVENSSLHINLNKKIIIKGYAYAELNLRSLGIEYAPAGTMIILSVNYNDLNPNAGAGKWIDTAIVESNGSFTAEVPVDDDGVFLSCEPLPFEYNQITSFGTYEPTEKRIYSANRSSYKISTSSNQIIEITYNDLPLASNAYKAKVIFTIVADLDQSTAGNEIVANKEITFYNDDWAITVTTDSDGKVEVEVPYNEIVRYWVSFIYRKNVWNGTEYVKQDYKYEVKGTTLIGPFTEETEVTINLGGGVKL